MLRAEHKDNKKEYFSWKIEDYKYIINNRNLFICPMCKTQLSFVDGTEVIKHFRHKVKHDCDFEPETEEHLEMKLFMKTFLDLKDDEVEVNLRFAKPDLFIANDNIAIEVQKSNITKKKFLERCYNYTKNKIAVMWIFHDSLFSEDNNNQNIPILLRTASENCFGRVYIYSNKKIFSIKFNPLTKWVDEYKDYNTGDVYGGYLKKYKKKKSIEIIQSLPDDKYGKKIYKVWTKGGRKTEYKSGGYYIAKFYDI